MQYLEITIKNLIILTEAPNGKQMHGFNEPDTEKMPKKKFWQDKEDFRAEQIQEHFLSLLLLWDATARITIHTECISHYSCLDLKGEKNVK